MESAAPVLKFAPFFQGGIYFISLEAPPATNGVSFNPFFGEEGEIVVNYCEGDDGPEVTEVAVYATLDYAEGENPEAVSAEIIRRAKVAAWKALDEEGPYGWPFWVNVD